MADGFRVEIHGVDELAAGTKKLAGKIEQGIPAEFGRVAGDVGREVAAALPRRTGRLAGSVGTEHVREGAAVSMGDGVPYAQFVEYGGRGHPHSVQGNYLYPAAMDAGPRLKDAGERLASREIAGMSWPNPS